jgi:hypothetical protein
VQIRKTVRKHRGERCVGVLRAEPQYVDVEFGSMENQKQ